MLKVALLRSRLSKWLVDAITLAYSSVESQCPIGVRAHSTRGIASSWAWSSGVSMSDICEVAGWSSPSTFVRFYNLDVPAVQATVLSAEIAIFWVHLTNIAQAPSFAWSVHKLYGHQVSFGILRTPLGLIPRESLFELFRTIARHDWTGSHTASSTP